MEHSSEPWWSTVERSAELRQGDFLPDCPVPIFGPEFQTSETPAPVEVKVYDCIVMTQSCDLVNEPAPPLVALCPVFSVPAFEEAVPRMAKSGRWEHARQGRIEGVHLLGAVATPFGSRDSLVVDFRQIYSLPFGYLSRYAEEVNTRHRLQSPYLEHLSQAFARFFMRVGLPSQIPKFK
jgi:hypothetical protein